MNPDVPEAPGSQARDWGDYNDRMQFITQHFRVNATNQHMLLQPPQDPPKGAPVGTIKVTSHLQAPPEKVREFVSDLRNFEKYAPGVSNTRLDDKTYQTDMRFLGLTYHADMEYQKTEKGVDFAGSWSLKEFGAFPRFTEQVSMEVEPAPDGGSLLTVREDYQLPRWMKPIFPMFRWTLRRMIEKEHEHLDYLLAEPKRGA